MRIKQFIALSSMSASRPGGPAGCHAWILLAMIHLTMDFSSCSPVTQGSGFKLISRPLPRHRLPHSPLWNLQNAQHWRVLSPWWNKAHRPELLHHKKTEQALKQRSHKHRGSLLEGLLCKECQHKYSSSRNADTLVSLPARNSAEVTFLKRPRRQVRNAWDSYDYTPEGWTTTMPEFIEWGPTGEDDTGMGEDKQEHKTNRGAPNSTTFRRTTTTTTASMTTTKQSPVTTKMNHAVITIYPGKQMTTESRHVRVISETARPPKQLIDTAGLAVHQIITITVSLIMVIAALITTLVLKNCCAQSGNGRRNNHQRKINQQEESCQNLTDFTPARVPSNMDIFTAYNENLQCSHECVRTAVPVYTDEMLQQTPVYKTTFNGNRPSPAERQLIPVAFVSEKWFEISC
ncbi:adherens junction-associated protein 1-like isoform X1 [Acipenser ruthenus]|nr:adherens junction-associated protein 1-like isoform X1 [Acipenser ruthenus]